MRIPRWLSITAALWAAVFLCIAVTLPPAAREASAPATAATSRFLAGAFHVHTTASDGGGTREDVALAGAAAGLDFVIVTDHGDGTAPPAGPEYRHGVLLIDGVEVSTSRGHYAAFGLSQAPYPLGGPPYAVIEDVARLGGFGAAAHPDSAKADLRWRDWGAPFDGLEVLNGDSAWRDEGAFALARALVAYPFRPAPALATLIQRPAAALGRLDSLNRSRRVVALAAADAHGRLPLAYEEGDAGAWAIPVPSYRHAFAAVRNIVDVAREPSGDPGADADAIADAIRRGRVTSAVPALALPAELSFTATMAGGTAGMGDRVAPGAMTFDARTPEVAGRQGSLVRLVLRRDGQIAAQADGPALSHRVDDPGQARGVWRVEAYLDHRAATPWMIGNPIVVADDVEAAPGDVIPERDSVDLLAGAWVVEKQAASEGEVAQDAGALRFSYRLAGGAPSGQFAAAVREGSPDAWSRVVISARASAPTRLWIQLRLSDSGSGQRWGRSVFVDEEWRDISIPLARFEPLEPGAATRRPVEAQVRSLLLVLDTVNSSPGRAGWVDVRSARLVR